MQGSAFSAFGSWIRIALLCLMVFAAVPAGTTRAEGEAQVYGMLSSFTWKEFDDGGRQLLKESGPLYGVGFIYRALPGQVLTLQPGVEFFGGNVDYDGATQSGVPVKTTVDYFGVKFKFEAGAAIPLSEGNRLERASLEPFAGLGVAVWSRKIKDSTAANGTTAYGYEEVWETVHVRVGLRGLSSKSGGSRLFAEAGIKIPVYNQNTAYLSDAGLGSDVTMHPGKKASGFAEAGVQIRKFRASFFYDGMRFSRSDNVASGMYIYYQPRSESDMFGMKLGAAF
ncbi:MAG TPA: hypothetical protein VK654_15885 [Nitrospirota bacterium]|nr:hypothetical protein [Nitrospirota bacterium]